MDLSSRCATLSKSLEKNEGSQSSDYVQEAIQSTHYSFRDKRCYALTTQILVLNKQGRVATEIIYDGADRKELASSDTYSADGRKSVVVPYEWRPERSDERRISPTEQDFRDYKQDVMNAR